MGRKKTETATAVPPTIRTPAPTSRAPRQRVPARQRALDALKTIELAVVGHDDSMIAAQNLGEMLARLPEGWEPKPLTPRGPLQSGDWAEPLPAFVAVPEHRHLSPPYKLREVYKVGRSIKCVAVDRDGAVAVGMTVSDLRRCAPPTEVPDVPQGDPAALGEPDEEPAAGDEVRL